MKKRVLVTGTALVSKAARDLLQQRGYEVDFRAQDNWTADELHEALAEASGYIIGGYEEPLAEHFERAVSLEVVAWPGTDYKGYVPGWQRGWELGIAFINTPGTNAYSVAEFTFALMFAATRGFAARVVSDTAATADTGEPGIDLFKKQLGIIGLGRIGSRVARIATLGFGMTCAYSAPRRKVQVESALGIAYESKERLLESSQVISLHRPSRASDEPFELGQEEFARIGDGAVLINTVRYDLVDPDALYEALQSGRLRAAAFDGVGDGRPWQRLVELGPSRFLAVPSMAFNTNDANDRASIQAAVAVCDVLDGGVPQEVNNPDFRDVRRMSTTGRS
jgi:phosphoglycerate dehydrogenase-like enzyme